MEKDPRRFLLVTTVKDEGPSIVEWVAHHRNLGFTDIIIYQNDSFDGTAKLLRTMARQNLIRYFPNPDKKRAWQNKAYRRVSRLEAFARADWVMVLDGDEFLSINVGAGRVGDLVDALPEGINSVQLNWKIFGSSFRQTTSDGLVTEDFVWGEDNARIREKLIGFKPFFKPSVYTRPGIHRPKVLREGMQESICNGSGIRVGDFDEKGWRSADPGLRRLAQVNHYVIRDAQRFIIKSDRGRTSNLQRDVALTYWNEYELYDEMDLSLARKAPQTRATIKMMDQLCNGRLGFLTYHARRLQRERFEMLMADPQYRELYEIITDSQAHFAPVQAGAAEHGAPDQVAG